MGLALNFLTDNDFHLFKDKIYQESGIHFSDINRPILESRIKERLKLKKMESPQDYFNIIIANKDELDYLLDSVTTNLTSFFRNEGHFNSLREEVIPEIIARKKGSMQKRIKIWSAGCSTGEEPYSLAIALLEILSEDKSWDIKILASDISLKSLLVAREGYYSKDKLDSVNPDYLKKYFNQTEGGYRIRDFVKSLIRFDFHNLKFDNGERDFDIILCRNVIIYFDRVAQQEVIKKFGICLNEDGYLFIGHSESLFGMESEFKFHKMNHACVYRKK